MYHITIPDTDVSMETDNQLAATNEWSKTDSSSSNDTVMS